MRKNLIKQDTPKQEQMILKVKETIEKKKTSPKENQETLTKKEIEAIIKNNENSMIQFLDKKIKNMQEDYKTTVTGFEVVIDKLSKEFSRMNKQLESIERNVNNQIKSISENVAKIGNFEIGTQEEIPSDLLETIDTMKKDIRTLQDLRKMLL